MRSLGRPPTQKRKTSKRTTGALFVALAIGLSVTTLGPRARAQSAEELKAARELFQEAYKDEQEKRHDLALEKFERVARVRESVSVRYRIAANLEALGRLREARDAFRTLATSRGTPAPNEQEIAKDSAARAHDLDKRIPHLAIRLEGWPPETRVTVDAAAVPVSTGARSVDVDPGEHVVSASAPGVQAYESRVKVYEGGEVDVTIPPPGAASGSTTTAQPARETGEPPSVGAGAPDRTFGYVALAAGGVLLASSVIVLVAREGEIRDLKESCPGDVCPVARQDELEGTKSRAEAFGPLGIGLGAAGILAAGIGTYLVLRPGPAASPPPANVTRLRVDPRAVGGGAIVSLHASF